MKYSEGFRASIVKKTQDGSGRSVYQLARETGINAATIKNWITQFKNGTLSMDGCDAVTPSQRNPGEKLALLLENQTIPDEAKGEWLRQDDIDMVEIEGRFGVLKRRYTWDLIKARLVDTSKAWIMIAIIVANLNQAYRAILPLLLLYFVLFYTEIGSNLVRQFRQWMFINRRCFGQLVRNHG